MKKLKWAAIIAIAIAVIALILYLRRDYIGREIANSFLSDTELSVTELSVESLATDRLRFSAIVIVGKSGTRIEVAGLAVQLGSGGTSVERIAADSVTITFDDEQAERAALGGSLQTVFDLPSKLPGFEARIGTLSLPDVPALTNLLWTTTDQSQELSFDIDAIAMTMSIDRSEAGDHQMNIEGIQAGGDVVLAMSMVPIETDGAFDIGGRVTIHTAAWLPLLRSLDLVPAGLDSFDAELQGPLIVELDEELTGHAAINARLTLVDELMAVYETSDGAAMRFQAGSLKELAIDVAYPAMEWTAVSQHTEAVFGSDQFSDLPATIDDLECVSGIVCTMNVVLNARNVGWSDYDVAVLNLSLPMRMEIGDVTRIFISADVSGGLGGVQIADAAAKYVGIESFSGTEMIIGEDDWYSRIDQLQLTVEEFRVAGKFSASATVTFSDLDIRDGADTIDTKISIPAVSSVRWDDLASNLPAIEGTVSRRNDHMTSSFALGNDDDALSARIELIRNLSTDAGSLAVNDLRMDFARAWLSDVVSDWPHAWDIVDGVWTGDLNIDWQTRGADTDYKGSMTHSVQGLAGKYDDIAFVGLSTTSSATLDSATGIEVAAASIDVGLLDVGLPLENISAEYRIDIDALAVDVQDLSVAAFGGEFSAEAFRYSAKAEANRILLNARSIQLQLMVDLAEFEDIEMTGAISGTLPVTIIGDKITIEHGRLDSDPPGGVIRYRSGTGLGGVGADSGLNIVSRALANFEFDSLSSNVDYTESGDLKLQMKLTGINPDMDATQPIILNLGVEDNVPQLLRSLRAIRSIEDILERQTAR